jgi:hypothetical protein
MELLMDTLKDLPLHDSVIYGIVVTEGSVHVSVMSEMGTSIVIRLTQAYVLRVENFLLGNIIFDVRVDRCRHVEEDALVNRLQTLFPDGLLNRQSIRKILQEDMILVEITPSYGCSIACLCVSVDIL